MNKKPLHLQQTRFLVRQCNMHSTRAQYGSVARWYIHDTDTHPHTPFLPFFESAASCDTLGSRIYWTRKDAVAALTRTLGIEAAVARGNG